MNETMVDEFKKGYKKGYEEGLKDGLNEAISIAARGYKSQELRIMLKSKMAIIDEKVDSRMERLGEPVIERESKVGQSKEIGAGGSYIVKETRFERSLDIFLKEAKGRHGLCITRVNPMSIEALRELPSAKLYWLTSAEKRKEKGYEFISPTDLVTLASTILSYLTKKKNGGVVLIQGVEYLISQNNFNVILKMIQKVNDSVVLTNSIFLISLNPAGIDDKDYNNLLKEMTQEL